MTLTRRFVHRDTPGEDRGIFTAVALGGTHEVQVAVFVLVVVPACKLKHVLARLIDIGKTVRRERWPVFAGAKQALGVGIVIAHPRATVRGCQPQLGKFRQVGRALHGTAIILVDHNHASRHALAPYRALDEGGGMR